MESLRNAKYELFAKYLADGKLKKDAYILAGYKNTKYVQQASSEVLRRHPEITARAQTLREQRAEDLRDAGIIPLQEIVKEESITQASLIRDLITFRSNCKVESSFIHTTNLIAQYLGFDKPMATTISSNMSDQELVEDVNAMINKMGGKPILLIESDNKES